jgi:hypothetical protein
MPSIIMEAALYLSVVIHLLTHGSYAFSSVRHCTYTCSRQRPSSSSSSSSPPPWSLHAISSSHTHSSDSHRTLLLHRRDALAKTAELCSASVFFMLLRPASSASSSSTPISSLIPPDKVYLRGTVKLQPGQSLPSSNEVAALYITVRPNVPDDAPRAILDGTRGKSPPVLSARFPIASSPSVGGEFFPFEFELTQKNLTPEGALILPAANNEGEEGDGSAMLWWEKNDKELIVSARLDTDGVASTRDPEDLVGRGISSRSSDSAAVVSIELRGRGLFGKSVTAKN